jgi:hypothetical protein
MSFTIYVTARSFSVVTCCIVELTRRKGNSCFSEQAEYEVYIDVFAFAFNFLHVAAKYQLLFSISYTEV